MNDQTGGVGRPITDPSTVAPVCLASQYQPEGTGLSFLDLLYAVDVGEVATRVSDAHLRLAPLSVWGSVAVVMSLIVLSWIGYHRDRAKVTADGQAGRQPPGDFGFVGLRFAQFMIELAIIAVYFVLAVRLQFPDAARANSGPSAQFEVLWVVIVFGLYLLWDQLDVTIATTWKEMAKHYRKVTAIAVAVFAILYGAVAVAKPTGSGPVFACDLVIVVLLYGYRAIQDP